MRSVQTLDHFCATFCGNLFILFSIMLMNNRCSLSLPHSSSLALPFPIPSRCAWGYEVGGYVCVCVCVCLKCMCVHSRQGVCGSLQESVSSVWGLRAWGLMLWLRTNGTHTRPFFWHTQLDTHTHKHVHTQLKATLFFCRISTHKSAPLLKQWA